MIRRTQILTWLVILLVVLNAVTIGTIIYHQYQEKKAANEIAISTSAGYNPLNGRFFRQELGFNSSQMDIFREANQEFRPVTMELTYRIDSLKEEMFSRLQDKQADTVLLNKLASAIGELHGRLKYETYRFYLRLQSACDEQQREKLVVVFSPLFKNENITSPGQRGQGPPWNRNQP